MNGGGGELLGGGVVLGRFEQRIEEECRENGERREENRKGN